MPLQTSTGYPTKREEFTQAAARHMKAKAALWLKDWDTTLEQVEEIEKSGHFDLIALNEVFNAGDLNHKEALMVQQWSKNPGGNLSTPLQKEITSCLFHRPIPYRNRWNRRICLFL